jgi:hypothetical protein
MPKKGTCQNIIKQPAPETKVTRIFSLVTNVAFLETKRRREEVAQARHLGSADDRICDGASMGRNVACLAWRGLMEPPSISKCILAALGGNPGEVGALLRRNNFSAERPLIGAKRAQFLFRNAHETGVILPPWDSAASMRQNCEAGTQSKSQNLACGLSLQAMLVIKAKSGPQRMPLHVPSHQCSDPGAKRLAPGLGSARKEVRACLA